MRDSVSPDRAAARGVAPFEMARETEVPLLHLVDVSFAAGTMAILSGVSLPIHAGRPVILVGPNGSGKTTLLKLVMGLLRPTGGRIDEAVRPAMDGTAAPLEKAFVLQRPVMLRRSVAANIAYALKAAGRRAEAGAVAALLDHVGLGALSGRPARQLSGGEQQRLAMARALARQPDVLLLDEPTASLDPQSTRLVEALIATIADAGVTVVLATHDLGQARRIGGDVALLSGGRLVERTPADRFFEAPQTETGRRFLDGELVL